MFFLNKYQTKLAMVIIIAIVTIFLKSYQKASSKGTERNHKIYQKIKNTYSDAKCHLSLLRLPGLDKVLQK